jgi:3-hydroxyisobutyrate dehydrogenase-like beta-hydroxyacid dehydrogenase
MPLQIGLLHPGAMGASIGAAMVSAGQSVHWLSAGRSPASQARAQRAGLNDAGTLDTLVGKADIILSICPPHNALQVAELVSLRGFAGLYLDANAISPLKTQQIAEVIQHGGGDLVDGGIIGGPAWHHGAGTTLHLSGPRATEIQVLFAGSPLRTNIVSHEIGAASALKMVFAAYSKGTTALLTAVLGVAEQAGVRQALEQQWGEEFTQKIHKQVTTNTAKAWRFSGEMREIAETFATAGLPDGFHDAAAQVFERLGEFKDSPGPSLDDVLATLNRSPRKPAT